MLKSVPKIAVVGSINMDLVGRCLHLPAPGETVTAEDFCRHFGGKGANQAVAASRAGGQVCMVGSVGDDVFADDLVRNLERETIDCRYVKRRKNTSSGLAMICVDEHGENQIVVVPGANADVSVDDVAEASNAIAECDLLLVQLEVPVAAIAAAMDVARRNQLRVLLDPAPVPAAPLPDEFFDVDLMCPNECEAAALCGATGSPQELASVLNSRGRAQIALTLGAQGTLLHETDVTRIAAPNVSAVDTTGAGDAFAGALAVRWMATGRLNESVKWANAAGALAASRSGAQSGMPTAQEIQSLFDRTRA